MTRARAISRRYQSTQVRADVGVARKCPILLQQPFDALSPSDTGCCAARASAIRSASPGRTIIRISSSAAFRYSSQTIDSIVGGILGRRPSFQYSVADTPLFDRSSSLTSRGQPAPGGCVLARPRSV